MGGDDSGSTYGRIRRGMALAIPPWDNPLRPVLVGMERGKVHGEPMPPMDFPARHDALSRPSRK